MTSQPEYPAKVQITPHLPRDAGVVVHSSPLRVCSYERDRCGLPSWMQPHCPTCTCPHPPPRADHGEYVRCSCGRDGILPDRDHLQDFLPGGTTVEYGTPERPDVVVITFGRGQ